MTTRTYLSNGWLLGIVLLGCVGLGVARFALPRSNDGVTPDLPAPVDTSAASAKSAEHLSLPQEEREYIWQLEHHGLVLVKYGFRPFAECLSRRDAKGMTARLAADFEGQVPQQSNEVKIDCAYAKVIRQQDTGKPPLMLTGPQYVQRLLELTSLFRNPKPDGDSQAFEQNQQGTVEVRQSKYCGYSFSLISLSPLERYDLAGMWEGTGLLRFWGETGPGQPAEVQVNIRFRTVRPTEETLAEPGWLHGCAILQSQVAQSPRFLLRDATKERGIDPAEYYDNWLQSVTKTTTGGVYLCDYDHDGIMDMLITDVNRYTLYRGKPDGTFEDATLAAGLPMTSLNNSPLKIAAAFVDIDGDGWEDLILGDKIYRNENGHFKNYTYKTNLRLPSDAIGLAIADYDRDGRLDFYVFRSGKSQSAESWLGGKSGNNKGNELWHNLGNWKFEEVAAKTGTDGDLRSTFSAVWLDANNDGWPDLYVINEFGNGVLLINEGNGKFTKHTLTEGVGDFGSMGVTVGDIDNDNNIDIFTANMYSKAGTRVIGNLKPGTYSESVMAKLRSFVFGSQLWHNGGGLKFDAIGKKCQVNSVGWSYGADFVDLDNDGFLDLYATCGFVSKDRNKPDG